MERSSVKRRGEGSHFVQENTEGPDVRFKAVALTLDDLRREIVGCADDSLGLGSRVREDTSDTKVTKLDDSFLGDEDVLRLKITVQDFLIVAVLHGQCDLGEPVEELIFRKVVLASLTINSLKALLDLALHVTVVGVVHDNAELAFLGLVDFAETHDIWVIKHLKNLCLV